jgi:hypothetical protein
MPQKIFSWAVVAFVIFYIARHPAEAAITVKGLASGLATGAQGFSDFFAYLVPKGPTVGQ